MGEEHWMRRENIFRKLRENQDDKFGEPVLRFMCPRETCYLTPFDMVLSPFRSIE